jgi:hypothetical protein
MLAALIHHSMLAAALLLAHAASAGAEPRYAWRPASGDAGADTLVRRIAPPAGFTRPVAAAGSFAEWLRGLPLKPEGAPVLLHTGAPKSRQDVHVAVVDIDTGTRDLQQCADAAMRLRAEWLFATQRGRDIAFNATGSGQPIAFARWAAGERPRVSGRTLSWSPAARPDAGYASFRRYMDTVFIWAGTLSLAQELPAVPVAALQAGDLFIKGGTPGHAVLVADLVENGATGERRFLLLQSYMPAQDIHVLKNPADAAGSPWYPLAFGPELVTPEWTFARESLRRWR